jgi:dTDP-3-amino-3,4,6-trideoxy-alpha-D-glucose transaminase
VADTAKLLRHHGTTNKQTHSLVGYNSRLDAIQAAMLRVLLPHLDEWNNARRTAAKHYDELGIGEFAAPQQVPAGAEPVFHLYVVAHDDAEAATAALVQAGVEARGYYRTPIHRQPAMAEFAVGVELPGTEQAAKANIALPISPAIGADQIGQVVEALSQLAVKRPASA